MARIVLIEDSPTDRAVFTQWLRRAGHEVLEADNAEDGLQLVRDQVPQLVNPASGWIFNANNSPWSAAGPGSELSREAYAPELGIEDKTTNRARRAAKLDQFSFSKAVSMSFANSPES